MDFIFMLTRDDATVANALDLVEEVQAAQPEAYRLQGYRRGCGDLASPRARHTGGRRVGVDGDRLDLAR